MSLLQAVVAFVVGLLAGTVTRMVAGLAAVVALVLVVLGVALPESGLVTTSWNGTTSETNCCSSRAFCSASTPSARVRSWSSDEATEWRAVKWSASESEEQSLGTL
jgi:nitrogen fixation protein FixH